jgi:hypothetical protein
MPGGLCHQSPPVFFVCGSGLAPADHGRAFQGTRQIGKIAHVSKQIILPSGKVATRFFNVGEFYWQLATVGTQEWVTLGAADIQALNESVEDMRPKREFFLEEEDT